MHLKEAADALVERNRQFGEAHDGVDNPYFWLDVVTQPNVPWEPYLDERRSELFGGSVPHLRLSGVLSDDEHVIEFHVDWPLRLVGPTPVDEWDAAHATDRNDRS